MPLQILVWLYRTRNRSPRAIRQEIPLLIARDAIGLFLHAYQNFVAKVCDIWSWNRNHWLRLNMLLRTSLSTLLFSFLLFSSLLFSFPLLLLCYLSPNFCNEPSVTLEIANFPALTTKQILLRHVVEAHWAIRRLLQADR